MSLHTVPDINNPYFRKISEDLSLGRLSDILNIESCSWGEIVDCVLLTNQKKVITVTSFGHSKTFKRFVSSTSSMCHCKAA